MLLLQALVLFQHPPGEPNLPAGQAYHTRQEQ
jgi:hypothetical protein